MLKEQLAVAVLHRASTVLLLLLLSDKLLGMADRQAQVQQWQPAPTPVKACSSRLTHGRCWQRPDAHCSKDPLQPASVPVASAKARPTC